MRRNAPETFNGQPVRFFSTFNSTVTRTRRSAGGVGDPSLLPLINLEIWGVPTSLPAQDPNNGGFIYQRFQRGIMHYDAACRCTQGLLLADYFKALLTGENLPADLGPRPQAARSCASTPPTARPGCVEPAALPGTDLTAAFTGSSAAVTAGAAAGRVAAASPAPRRRRSPRRRAGWPPTSRAAHSGSATASGQPSTRSKRPHLTAPLQAILDSDTELAFGPLPESVHARYSRIGSQPAAARSARSLSTRAGRQATRRPSPRCSSTRRRTWRTTSPVSTAHARKPATSSRFGRSRSRRSAWQAFYGPNGKAEPRDELDVELNAWLGVYRRGPGGARRSAFGSCTRAPVAGPAPAPTDAAQLRVSTAGRRSRSAASCCSHSVLFSAYSTSPCSSPSIRSGHGW